MDTKPAALEYVRQMRLALRQQGGPLLHRPPTFGYWKGRFDVELARAREHERMRMALSQDWSGLGKYSGESLLILRHSIALDAAGILSRLRCPGALKLFEPSVAVILRTVFQCGAGCQPARDWQSRLGF